VQVHASGQCRGWFSGEYVNLAAIDIYRTRERKNPRFNDFREQLGLERFKSFEDINNDTEVCSDLAPFHALFCANLLCFLPSIRLFLHSPVSPAALPLVQSPCYFADVHIISVSPVDSC
jgi:Animal haem peroxidase